MEIVIDELIWNEWNIQHIARHNVSVSEVVEACIKQIYVDKTYENRYLLVGRTIKRRLVSIVLSEVANHKFILITARDSSRGERKKVHDKESK